MPSGLLDATFPLAISQGATVGPGFSTTITASASGHEQRDRNWRHARLRFDVGPQLTDDARIQAFLAFWRVVAGQAYAFRFRDPSDFTVGYALGPNGYEQATPQPFAVGAAGVTRFVLNKRYTVASYTVERPILLPILANLEVFVGGVQQTTGWAFTDGAVVFSSPPAAGAVIAWRGWFDVPCRFDTDRPDITLKAVRVGSASVPVVEVRLD